jgi:2-hydroxychromene-2-carboxylate isomerase
MDFWFEFASTYSYPAAMRIDGPAQAAGATVRWRPFLLGPIFGAASFTVGDKLFWGNDRLEEAIAWAKR